VITNFLFSSIACVIGVGSINLPHNFYHVCKEPNANNASCLFKSQKITGAYRFPFLIGNCAKGHLAELVGWSE
jgi:hypothetical protein